MWFRNDLQKDWAAASRSERATVLAIPIGLGSFMLGIALPTLMPSLPYWLAVALAVLGIVVALPAIFLVVRDYGLFPSGGRKMVWVVGMIFSAFMFVFFSYRFINPDDPVPLKKEEILTGDERLRRKYLVDDARLAYIIDNVNVDPDVVVGLKSVPEDYINRFLAKKGESWKEERVDPIALNGDGLFVSCENVSTPIQYIANDRIFTWNLWPDVADHKITGGLGQNYSPKSGPMDFGHKGMTPILKCTITNYSNRVLKDIVLGADIAFQTLVPDQKLPTTKRGGEVTVRYPAAVFIDRLDSGKLNQFGFYIPNLSGQAMHINFRATAKAKFMSGDDIYILHVSTSQEIPYISFPSNI